MRRAYIPYLRPPSNYLLTRNVGSVSAGRWTRNSTSDSRYSVPSAGGLTVGPGEIHHRQMLHNDGSPAQLIHANGTRALYGSGEYSTEAFGGGVGPGAVASFANLHAREDASPFNSGPPDASTTRSTPRASQGPVPLPPMDERPSLGSPRKISAGLNQLGMIDLNGTATISSGPFVSGYFSPDGDNSFNPHRVSGHQY